MSDHELYRTAHRMADDSAAGWLLGRKRRAIAVAVTLDESANLPLESANKAEFRQLMRERVKYRLKRHPLVGFPWVTLAMLVAEIVIKLLVERWFTK